MHNIKLFAIIRKKIENVTKKIKNNMSVARILFYFTIFLMHHDEHTHDRRTNPIIVEQQSL